MDLDLEIDFFAHTDKATKLLRRSISILKNEKAGSIESEKAVQLTQHLLNEAEAETIAAMKACKDLNKSR